MKYVLQQLLRQDRKNIEQRLSDDEGHTEAKAKAKAEAEAEAKAEDEAEAEDEDESTVGSPQSALVILLY